MTDQPALTEAELAEWLNNPYWAGYYREAPSQLCKDYIALQFLYSDTGEDETARELDRMEECLGLDDWKHLLKYSASGPERGKILGKIGEWTTSQSEVEV